LFTQIERLKSLNPVQQRKELALLGQAEFNGGRDGTQFIEALNANTPDELNLNIFRLSTTAGNLAGQFDEVLKANAPAGFENVLDADGKVIAQRNIKTGEEIKTPRETAAGDAGLVSAKTEIDPITGSTIQVVPTGPGKSKVVVTDPAGAEVTGQARADVLKNMRQAKRTEAQAQADLKVQTERRVQQVRDAEEQSNKAFGLVDQIRQNVTNLEEITPLVGQGANTGPIERFFPSFKAATIKLENLQKRLSLDVVGAVTFGALSKGELDLAKAVAIPSALEGDDLIDWVNDKIEAQNKLADYFERQAIFLSEGNSQTDWLKKQRDDLQQLLAVSGATEADIRQTMRDNDMTRSQVLQELRRRANGP
jgi:hypothetical protein